MWHDYIKDMQNLERCAINYSYWVKIQGIEPGNHILRGWKVDKWV